jgi:hypothetical protein
MFDICAGAGKPPWRAHLPCVCQLRSWQDVKWMPLEFVARCGWPGRLLNVTKTYTSSLNHGSKSHELAWLGATALQNLCKRLRHPHGAAVSVASSPHTPSGHPSRWHCSRHSGSGAAIDAAADWRQRNMLNSGTGCGHGTATTTTTTMRPARPSAGRPAHLAGPLSADPPPAACPAAGPLAAPHCPPAPQAPWVLDHLESVNIRAGEALTQGT